MTKGSSGKWLSVLQSSSQSQKLPMGEMEAVVGGGQINKTKTHVTQSRKQEGSWKAAVTALVVHSCLVWPG
jgi:hypothetical protein